MTIICCWRLLFAGWGESLEAVCTWKSRCFTNNILWPLSDLHHWQCCLWHTSAIWVSL